MKNNNPLLHGHKYLAQHNREYLKTLASLANSQAPHSIVICCCDSRIDPIQLFNAKPGQVFTIRNAGGWVPPSHSCQHSETVAALQIALNSLPIQRILVLGHSNCAAANALKSQTAQPLQNWLQQGRALCTKYPDHSTDPSILEQTLVTRSVEALKTWDFIKNYMQTKSLLVEGAWFSMNTTKLLQLQPDGRFLPA